MFMPTEEELNSVLIISVCKELARNFKSIESLQNSLVLHKQTGDDVYTDTDIHNIKVVISNIELENSELITKYAKLSGKYATAEQMIAIAFEDDQNTIKIRKQLEELSDIRATKKPTERNKNIDTYLTIAITIAVLLLLPW